MPGESNELTADGDVDRLDSSTGVDVLWWPPDDVVVSQISSRNCSGVFVIFNGFDVVGMPIRSISSIALWFCSQPSPCSCRMSSIFFIISRCAWFALTSIMSGLDSSVFGALMISMSSSAMMACRALMRFCAVKLVCEVLMGSLANVTSARNGHIWRS